jgi:hypothetical protein
VINTALASLSVRFGEERSDGGRIVLEQMTKRFNFRGELVARCFFVVPELYLNFPMEYISSVGTASAGEYLPQIVYGEGVTFSGSASAQLKYPNATNVIIDTERSLFMRETTLNGRRFFERVTVVLVYDETTGSVVTDDGMPVYGAASASYEAIYQLVYYKPEVLDRRNFNAGAGLSFSLGTLFAYNETGFATLDMELDTASTPDWIEYARVSSKIVLDPKGVWEFPPNWESTYQGNKKKIGDQRDDYPADGEFPSVSDTVEGGNSFVDERVHLIVEVNSSSALRYRDFNNGGSGHFDWEQPYFGSRTYQPTYEINFSDPPGGQRATSAEDFSRSQYHRTWRNVFVEVDKAALIEKIRREYPGATER